MSGRGRWPAGGYAAAVVQPSVTRLDHPHPVDPERVERAQARLIDVEDAARLTSLLSLVADPVRLRLLYALDMVEELCVGDLALALEVSEDQAGYALRILRGAGLVVTRKHGRVVFNRLAADFPEPLREHCLRQLVELTRRPVEDDADPARDEIGATGPG